MRVFLSSHGRFAEGIVSSVRILLGDSEAEKLHVFSAYVDDRNLKDELDAFFKDIPEEEHVILLSDLNGGSVNTAMIPYLERPNTDLLTGVNLTLAIELLVNDEMSDADLDELVQTSKDALKRVRLDNTEETETQEDFF